MILYVKNKIEQLIQECELNNTLLDMLFLLNNIILEIISNGRSFTISKEGTSYVDVDNTVGGYITIQIMTMTGIHDFNYLGSPYDVDSNCLLDKTTYPFSRYVDNNKVIRYVDNLSMLVRNIFEPFNSNISETLIALVSKQINYIVDKEIMSESLMNDIVSHINIKYTLEIPLFAIEDSETNSSEVEKNLKNLFFDNAPNEVDISYLLRFFN